MCGTVGNKLHSIYLTFGSHIELLTSRCQGPPTNVSSGPGGVHFASGPVQVWLTYGPGGGNDQDVLFSKIMSCFCVNFVGRRLLSHQQRAVRVPRRFHGAAQRAFALGRLTPKHTLMEKDHPLPSPGSPHA